MNDENVLDAIQEIIEMNRVIVRQNFLIVQALTLPNLMVKRDEDHENNLGD